MDDKQRRQMLDRYIKEVRQGIPFAEEFTGKTGDVFDDALVARNLTEDSLGREVLKNTGVPIPGKGSTRSQAEDFLNRMVKERYPELEPNVRIGGDLDQYGQGEIDVSDFTAKSSPERAVGTVLHEAGHQYDDKILGTRGKELNLKDLRKAKSGGMNLKQMDPLQVYEDVVGVGHHAKIPKLREGTYGFGALKSLLKSGTFKGLAPAAVGAAFAGSASDALADTVVPGGVESVGEGSDMPMMDDTPQVQMAAEAATDPNLKRAALKELRDRSRR